MSRNPSKTILVHMPSPKNSPTDDCLSILKFLMKKQISKASGSIPFHCITERILNFHTVGNDREELQTKVYIICISNFKLKLR